MALNKYLIEFTDPVTGATREVLRSSRLGRAAEALEQALADDAPPRIWLRLQVELRALCEEAERQHQIFMLSHDRQAQRGVITRAAARAGRRIEWR